MKVRKRPRMLLRTKMGEDHTIEDKQPLQKNKRAQDMNGVGLKTQILFIFLDRDHWASKYEDLSQKLIITSQNSVYVSLGQMSRNAMIFRSSGRDGFECHTYIMFWGKTRDTNIYHSKHWISDINLIAFLFEKGHSVLIYIIVNSSSRPS